jgi:hypothetical protein
LQPGWKVASRDLRHACDKLISHITHLDRKDLLDLSGGQKTALLKYLRILKSPYKATTAGEENPIIAA